MEQKWRNHFNSKLCWEPPQCHEASPVFQVFVVADSEVLEQEPEVAEPEAKLGWEKGKQKMTSFLGCAPPKNSPQSTSGLMKRGAVSGWITYISGVLWEENGQCFRERSLSSEHAAQHSQSLNVTHVAVVIQTRTTHACIQKHTQNQGKQRSVGSLPQSWKSAIWCGVVREVC